MILNALLFLVAQASPTIGSTEQARLEVCLDDARRDPANAIVTANAWSAEVQGPERALPFQCLGHAYVSLLRWGAAERAFRTAADLAEDPAARARLAAMAGSAALPEGRYAEALALFEHAEAQARASGDLHLAGSIAADRSRALAGLDRFEEAAAALDEARSDAPQYAEGWLLSATLARRQGNLDRARHLITQASALGPDSPDIALEAGVIAVLSGDEVSARKAWQAVLRLASDSDQARTARSYLAQIEGTGP